LAHRVHTRLATALESAVMGRADRLLAPSRSLANDVDPDRDDDRIVLVPNGVDLDELAGIDAAERAAARAALGVPADAFVVAFLGEHHTPRKGLGPLLDAIARTSVGVHLVVAGRGPDLDDRLRALGIETRVHTVGFQRPRTVLAASDAAAVPSWYEPFSLVAVEAAAAGLPVVITAAAGAAAYLDGGAIVLDAPDAAELAAAIDRLAADADAARAIGAAARTAVEQLDWASVAARASDVIEDVAASRRRPRIAYVTDTMADVRMLEGFAAHAEVTVVGPASLGDRLTNFWPPRPPAAVERVVLPGGRVGFVPRAAAWLVRHRHRVDAVIVLDNLLAALAANLGRAGGGPPVVLQVGRPTIAYLRCQPSTPKALARRAAARVLVAANERAAAAVAAVSEHCAADSGRRNRTVAAIAAYGVDVHRFRPVVDRAEARRRLDLPVDRPIVMLRSRLAPEKDPDTFLRAIGRLRAEGRDVFALYMGGELDELAAASARVGVAVEGRKPKDVDEIPLWYIAADVNVQSSHAEGLGVSPLEALACGTPVVVTDVGGLPEVVDHGRVGALFPPGDDAALARAIARYLDDPELAARHAEDGRQHVLDRYASDVVFREWAALIEEVAM